MVAKVGKLNTFRFVFAYQFLLEYYYLKAPKLLEEMEIHKLLIVFLLYVHGYY